MGIVIHGVLIGVIATIGMDIWEVVVKLAFRLPTTDWAMVGRWLGHMPGGEFARRPMVDSAAVPNELAIGWIAHYVAGIGYGLAYLYVVRVLFSSDPSLISALAFGLISLIAHRFIMPPGAGTAISATKNKGPGLTRLINVSIHIVFGALLYVGWLLTQ